MVFKILMRTGGVVAFGLLILLRVYLVGHLFYPAHRPAALAGAATNSAPQANYRTATIAPSTDTSGWILFTSTDPQTGLRMRHARLTAASGVLIDGHPGPPNVLEVVEQGADKHHIRLTLQAPSRCPGITSVHALFGTQAATLAVKPVDNQAGCSMDVLDYATILQTLRDADVMTISAGNGPEIRFDVAGLSWD
jgi:hypothetical protein